MLPIAARPAAPWPSVRVDRSANFAPNKSLGPGLSVLQPAESPLSSWRCVSVVRRRRLARMSAALLGSAVAFSYGARGGTRHLPVRRWRDVWRPDDSTGVDHRVRSFHRE